MSNWKQAVSDIPAAVRLRGAHALLMILAAIALVLVSAPTVSAADVDAVRLWRAPDHTRVVLDLSGATDFSTLSLENPERFVVDLSQSRLSASLTSLPLEGTPISRKYHEPSVRAAQTDRYRDVTDGLFPIQGHLSPTALRVRRDRLRAPWLFVLSPRAST